jgi:F-type H+-transporting ATPase subunit b
MQPPVQEAAGIFIIPNATIIFEFIALFLLLFLLRRYALPPLLRAMEERQEVIKKQIEESKEARENLEKAQQEYKDALAQARHEATQMRDQARSDAKRIREELEQKAREEAAAIAAANQRQMEIERQRVMSQLRREMGGLAVELASRIVGESLEDEARRSRTVDRFIEEVEAESGQPTSAGAGGGTPGRAAE